MNHARLVRLVCALALSSSVSAQTCPNNDVFEPNDDCGSATPLGAGVTAGLALLEGPVPFQTGDFDLFRITIPPGEALSVRTRYDPSLILQPRLMSADCSTTLDVECCSGDDEVTYGNPSAQPLDVVLSLGYPLVQGTPPCVDYELDVSLGFDTCLSIPDDAFEPNDDCASAPLVGPGTLTGLKATEEATDHYRIDVPPDHRLTVRTLNGSAPHGFSMRRSEAGTCGQLVGLAGTQGERSWTNLGGSTQEITVQVAPSDDCVLYDLELSVALDPCTTEVDDAFEPNDSLEEAAPLAPGRYDDLFVIFGNSDHFRFDVDAGETMTVIVFNAPLSAPGTDVFLSDDINFPLFTEDTSGPGYRQFRWFNHSNFSSPVNLAISGPSQSPGAVCTRYDLVLSIEDGEAGSAFCAGDVNGTGAAAQIAAQGTSSVLANDLVLRASPVPAGTFGLFFHGPGPANGDLSGRPRCVAGPFRRGPVVGGGAGDTLEWVFDNTQHAAVFVGATRYFQTWFRDPGGTPAHNVSNGYSVTFTH